MVSRWYKDGLNNKHTFPAVKKSRGDFADGAVTRLPKKTSFSTHHGANLLT